MHPLSVLIVSVHSLLLLEMVTSVDWILMVINILMSNLTVMTGFVVRYVYNCLCVYVHVCVMYT